MSIRYFSVCCLSLLLVTGFAIDCGKKGPTFQERIKALEDKGAPDSILSNVKVYLSNFVYGAKTGQAGLYKDSLKTSLSAAEAWYEEALKTSKPIVESLKKSFMDRKATLSGLPLKAADSLLAIADPLINKGFLLQAQTKLEKFDTVMATLVQNEAKAKELRKELIGTWKDVHVVKPNEDEGLRFKALETRIFTFKADGAYEGLEEMHGQTTPFLKEDWKFITSGKWDLMGDTIYQFITRENCAEQVFTQLNIKTNKWDRNVKPTYDSTITSGKKDRFITYYDLKIAYKKGK
jgi:hypothetical protein